MTSLRFVGDVPVWAGLILSLTVCLLAWRCYARESLDLNQRLRWLLPLLRSMAFLLGILVLTGPVLHHRSVIGELGSVQIYVDGSQSMNLVDPHLSAGRKLLIAEQQGWLPPKTIDAAVLEQAYQLRNVRELALLTLQREQLNAGELEELRDTLLAGLNKLTAVGTESDRNLLITALTDLPKNTAEAMSRLQQACSSIADMEEQCQVSFNDSVQRLIDSGDPAVQAALVLFDETPRWQRAGGSLLGTTQALFSELRQQHNVEILALQDDTAIELFDGRSSTELPQEFPPAVNSRTTDLASGITASQGTIIRNDADSDTADAAARSTNPNRAIVLLTDGQHNSGPSPLQTARVLGSQGVPFYPVSLGADRPAPDVTVIGVTHPDVVFQKDRVRGTIVVRDQMPIGQPMVVSVSLGRDILWQENLVTQNSGERRIEFDLSINESVERLTGQFTSGIQQHAVPLALTALVAPVPGEAETENNQQTFRFAAVTELSRLLVIDGRSRWETRYLRNVFARDTQWDVNVIIAGPGTDDQTLRRGTSNGTFPETRDALFENDLIIFGEIDPALFQEHELEWLREFVELRGGGIVFVDGQRGRLRDLQNHSLGTLLPVEWSSQQITTAPQMLQLTDIGRREPALSLEENSQANQNFWKQLPPPHQINRVDALPGSEVLVEAVVAATAHPLLVTRTYGAGRVVYLAADETWRWRYKVADTWHQRIWNQLARYVMPRPFASSDEYLSIDTGSVSYQAGETAPIRIRLRGVDGQPAVDATVDALIRKEGRIDSTVSLTADPNVPGLYRGNSGALSPGDYDVRVRASGFSQEALQAYGQFVVLPAESGELENTSANESLLQQMAVESGGTFLREEQMVQLTSLLSPLSSGRVEESDSSLFESSVWSFSWFATIIVVLGLEWFLRKRAGLL